MAVLTQQDRYTLIASETHDDPDEFAREVEIGLTRSQKSLPCRFFYDHEGSILFEAICDLAEYYLTRTERMILETYAREIVSLLPENTTLVELGSGSAAKTRILIEAFLDQYGTLRYVPVDISRTILEESSLVLLADYPDLEIVAVAAEYYDGLHKLKTLVDGPQLILWLGSNVGNFARKDAARFLSRVRGTMEPRDRLLVGIDLRKDPDVLVSAYDDQQGVTAQFNLNVLARINRELGGHFDVEGFRHRAVYNDELGRIEMYIDSVRDQVVRIDRLGRTVSFAAGESIHTESSYKYSFDEIEALGMAADLHLVRRWVDRSRLFSVNLFESAG